MFKRTVRLLLINDVERDVGHALSLVPNYLNPPFVFRYYPVIVGRDRCQVTLDEPEVRGSSLRHGKPNDTNYGSLRSNQTRYNRDSNCHELLSVERSKGQTVMLGLNRYNGGQTVTSYAGVKTLCWGQNVIMGVKRLIEDPNRVGTKALKHRKWI